MDKVKWVRDGGKDEDIRRQIGVERWRQEQNAGSMSLNVWKTNDEINVSPSAGLRLNLMQSKMYIKNIYVQPLRDKTLMIF